MPYKPKVFCTWQRSGRERGERSRTERGQWMQPEQMSGVGGSRDVPWAHLAKDASEHRKSQAEGSRVGGKQGMALELLSGGAGGLHPPAPTSTTAEPHAPAAVTRGNFVILNISKPPCWAPFPDSGIALSHLRARAGACHELLLLQRGSAQDVAAALESLSSVRALNGAVQELQWARFSHQTQPKGQPTPPRGATAHWHVWLTGVGGLQQWQQWPPPPAGTDTLLYPGCDAKTPLHSSQPCDRHHVCHWHDLKRQMDGEVPGWPDHCAGDVSSRCQRDWSHIYSGLFQCFSWPWGQVLLTATCLMLGNNLKQTFFNFFFFLNTKYNKNVLTAENSCFTILDIFFFPIHSPSCCS